MKYLLVILISFMFFQPTNGQSLSFEDLVNVLKMPVVNADDFLSLKGYKFTGKENMDGIATILYSYVIGKSQPTAKVVQKVIWDGRKTTQYYVCYITFDMDEYLGFRKLIVDDNYKRLDKDVSEEANYSNGSLDVTFKSKPLEGLTSYWITVYPTMERSLVDIARELQKKSVNQ